MLVQRPRVVAGRFPAREGVQVTSHCLQAPGDLESVPRAGSLEEHVLEEVRESALACRLVARSDLHPDADRQRADGIDFLPDKREARGENQVAEARLVRGAHGESFAPANDNGGRSLRCVAAKRCVTTRVNGETAPAAGHAGRHGLRRGHHHEDHGPRPAPTPESRPRRAPPRTPAGPACGSA